MTDYLEPLLDNAAALLERVRRLEESRTAPGREPPGSAVPAVGQVRNGRDAAAELGRLEGVSEPAPAGPDTASGPISEEKAAKEGATAPPSSGAQQEAGTEEGNSQGQNRSLLDQLERLEWAQAVQEGGLFHATAPEGSPTVDFPLSLDGPGRRWAGGEGLPGWNQDWGGRQGRTAPSSEALDWTEQADRIFRRDSRRYDGGFSLY